MSEIKHPSILNPWQTYRQAKTLLKQTSRASNADWYREAYELDRQWHIWIDGAEMASAVFDRKSGQWIKGPDPVLPKDTGRSIGTEKSVSDDAVVGMHENLNQEQFEAVFSSFDENDLKRLHVSLSELVKGKEYGGKVKSLGIVLHVAEEFSLADLAPEYSMDDDFDSLRNLLGVDPMEALGDSTIDRLAQSWNLLPYWGIKEGERRSVSIQVSRKYHSLIEELTRYSRTRNIPIRTAVLSAPLEALRMAPFFLDASDTSKEGNIFVFNYQRFSALAVLDRSGELVMMRSLPHRPGQGHANRLGEVLVNTAASVGLEDPLVSIVLMSRVGQEALTTELGAFFSSRPPMNIGLVDPYEIEELKRIPESKIEMLTGDPDSLAKLAEDAPLKESETIQELGKGWALQDFLGENETDKEIYPSQKDLKMLRFFGYAKFAVLGVLVVLVGTTAWNYVRTITTDAWRLPDAEAGEAAASVEKKKQDRDRVMYWENVMARRSEGWLVMEVLLQLFEPGSGLIVSECTYEAAGEQDDQKARKLAFRRQWIVKGYGRSEGAAMLAKLSSNAYLKEKFENLSAEFGVESLRLDTDTRTLDVSMTQRQSPMPANNRFPASVARHYRTSFEITITQEFSEEDALALTMEPPKVAATESNSSN